MAIKPPEQHAGEIRDRLREIETETTVANRTLLALAAEQHGLEQALVALVNGTPEINTGPPTPPRSKATGPRRTRPKGTERAVPPKGIERAVPPKGESLTTAAAQAKRAQGRKRGRPKGTGKRPAQIIQILSHGALTTREISEQLGLKSPSYLYRVLPAMQEEGVLLKVSDGTWKLDRNRPRGGD